MTAAARMRAVVAAGPGGPEVLEPREVPRPAPGAGQVLVRMRRIGVNFSDTERRRALGTYAAQPFPWIPGGEGAGVVEEVGPDAGAVLAGERVAFWNPAAGGAYAELAAVPADALFRLGELDFESGAALPLQGLTAWGVVRRAGAVRAGQTVLLHAAAGGVGLLALQLARLAGARVLGTVSSLEKGAAVAALGGEPLLYGDDLAERVRAATGGRGVDVVLDSVGRATQEASLAALAPFGRLVFFGDASGPPRPVDPDELYGRSLSVGAFGLDPDRDLEVWSAARQELLHRVEEGSLRLTVSRVLPLAEAAEAHRLLESRRVVGKVLLGADL